MISAFACATRLDLLRLGLQLSIVERGQLDAFCTRSYRRDVSNPAYELPPAEEAPIASETDPLLEIEQAEGVPGVDDAEDDPYVYGWREHRELTADGEDRIRRTPLTYQDLLDPQEGDFIAEDTVHRKVTEGLADILERRYSAEPTVAVWRNLKIVFHVEGLTSGPAPDLCVVTGVEDRDRRRRSFRYGQEPGKVSLVIEVVSKSSVKKDYRDLLKIYAPLGVEEYVAIRPLGHYPDGPFALTAWRLDRETRRLRPIATDPQGRIHSQTTGLLLGTGKDGWRLAVWDAESGERLRRSDEEAAWQEERAERAQERAERAEQRAEQEAATRRAAEAEIERLRAEARER